MHVRYVRVASKKKLQKCSNEGDERVEAVNTTKDLDPGLYRNLVLRLIRHWIQAKS